MCNKQNVDFEECKEQRVMIYFQKILQISLYTFNYQLVSTSRKERKSLKFTAAATKPVASVFVPRQFEHTGVTMIARRCFNCFPTKHGTASCLKPPREPGSCLHCGGKDQQLKECPQRRNSKDPIALEEEINVPFVPALLKCNFHNWNQQL